MQLTPEIVEGFSLAVLASRYDDPKPVPQFHREMWAFCCSPAKRVAIAAPRGHAKSTAITFAYVTASIVFRQSRHILIISANEDLAANFVGDIRVEFEENELLRDRSRFKKWIKESESELIGQFNDGTKFRVIAKGAGQRMRGLKWERKRPDLVIGDDLEDDEMVLNPQRREKFRRWFYGALRPIIKDGGLIRIVGTIVHMDSLLERMMPKMKDPDTVIEPLRMYSRTPKEWLAVKYRAHDSDFSNILWPEQFSKETLLDIKADFEFQGLLDLYGQEYLNDPIDDSTAYFKRDDMLELTDEMRARETVNYILVDFAISQEQKADYTVILGIGVDFEGNVHVKYLERGRWDSQQIIDEMMVAQQRLKADACGVEKGAIQQSIGPFLYEQMRKTGTYLNLIELIPTKDKVKRAQSIRARMRAGTVYFDKEASWYPELEEELTRFPKAVHDDMVDALSWAGLLLNDLQPGRTTEEIDEETYQNELFEFLADGGESLDGRSDLTGY